MSSEIIFQHHVSLWIFSLAVVSSELCFGEVCVEQWISAVASFSASKCSVDVLSVVLLSIRLADKNVLRIKNDVLVTFLHALAQNTLSNELHKNYKNNSDDSTIYKSH